VQQKLSPTTVVVALLIVAIVIAGIWWMTVGKGAKKGGKESIDAGTMQPKTPEEAAKAGYKQGGGGQMGGQPGMGGPPAGK
jgi:hypothetical protein